MQAFRLQVPLLLAALALPGCGRPAQDAPPAGEESPEPASPLLLVVNKSASTLSVLDPATGEELRTIETGFTPHEVAVSPGGDFAYVTDYGTGSRPGSTVTVVDLDSLAVVRTLSLEPHTRPHGIAVASDGTLWVTTEGSRHVLHVDPNDGTILQAVETGQEVTHMVAVAEGVGRVIAANIGSGTVTLIDAATGTVAARLETGAGAEGLAVHPDGTRAYVTNREAGTLTEIDLVEGKVLRTLEVGEFPIRVRVLGDGTEALVSDNRGNRIVAVDLREWRVVRELPVGAGPVGILLTPDDATVFVANTQDDRLTVVDLRTWSVTGELRAGDEPDGMAWVG